MAPADPPRAPNPSRLVIDADEVVALQHSLDFRQRKALAPEFARRVTAAATELGVTAPDGALGAGVAAELEDAGYARLGRLLDAPALADVLGHFAQRPCFNAHVYAKSDRVPHTSDELAGTSHFACYRQEDVVAAPHLLELANDARVLSAVSAYLGCVPTLYSMNAWWSFPRGGAAAGFTQQFHRDEDDLKNCVLFLYLTDVAGDGCHEYVRSSHRPAAMAQRLGGAGRLVVDVGGGSGRQRVAVEFDALFTGAGYGGDAVYRALFGDLVEAIEGGAGDGFLSDPDGLHRARHPEARQRLIVWVRYGMARNRAYLQDGLWPVARAQVAGRLPDTPQSRFINRLVIAPD